MKVALGKDMATCRFFAVCPKHGRVDLPDDEQDALAGLTGDINGLPFPTECPECKKDAEKEEDFAKRQTMIANRKEQAQIPPRFTESTVRDFRTSTPDMEKAKAIAIEYLSGFSVMLKQGTGMIFSGPPGTGKTHMACAIINRVIEGLHTARYTTGLSLKRAIQETYSTGGPSRSDVMRGYLGCDLLVIDEVDLMQATDDAQYILWDVVSSRYNLVKPTILVTNLNKQQLTEAIGERIIDRMRENGGTFVSFSWASHRKSS